MVKNTSRKGYNKCTAWDNRVKGIGWEKVHGEHRYLIIAKGGMRFPRTCNIAGFDRLYMTDDGPVLIEVCDDKNMAVHRKTIEDRLKDRPLLAKNFHIGLVIYYGGHKKLHSTTKERKWTKAGTWAVEWFN